MGFPSMPMNYCYKLPCRFPLWYQKHSAIVLLLLIPNVLCGVSSSSSGYHRYDEVTNEYFDYCTIECATGIGTHTLCLYPEEGPGPDCSGYTPAQLSVSEIKAIVDKHNELRNVIALGQVPGFPAAANMMEMSWDEELAMIAQRWADQCYDRRDQCRDSRRGFFVNQNSTRTSKKYSPYSINPEDLIQYWYNQIGSYSYTPGPYRYYRGIGQFTQIVWANTRLIGCARSRYLSDDSHIHFFVCNYGPAGNTSGQLLYEEGTPCSRCTCSDQYTGLCAVDSTPTE